MPILADLNFALNFIGLKNLLRTLRYTLNRDWLDRQYIRKQARLEPQICGDLIAQEKGSNGGLQFKFEHFLLNIRFLTPESVQIGWRRRSETAQVAIPYAIAKNEWPPVDLDHSIDSGGVSIASAETQIYLSRAGELTFSNKAGQIIHRLKPPLFTGKSWILESYLAPEECIFGLGEQADGFNLRGSEHRMVNTDPGGSYGPGKDPLYFPFPVYMGLNHHGSYLVFHENTFPGFIKIDPQPAREEISPVTTEFRSEARLQAEFESPTSQFYFLLGSPTRLVEQFTELTGRPPLPPRWALGYHQSRWGYASEQDIRLVVAGFQSRQLPISAIHLDIDYMDGYRVFTIDRQRYPDLSKLAEELAAANIRVVAILDPGVKVDPGYPLYQEGLAQGFFCDLPDGKPVRGLVWPGWSVYPDFTNPDVRHWWGSKYTSLLHQGISGFWHDMNEPTSFSSWGGLNLTHSAQHHLEGQTGDHRQAKNIYALQMNRAGYEALQGVASGKRPWLISRSGWAGNQRYAWNWTGDTESSWESLRMTIATILGLGLCGIPFTGPDIGGFSGDPSPELYTRWFQLAAFLPFFRTHSALTTPKREPWVFGEPFTGIVRDFLRLRYKLLPYLYTLAWESSQSGAPLVRPIFWNDPEMRELWEIGDEFLLGNALLVAPVLEAACRKRVVVFPPGLWVDFWQKDDPILGPCTSTVDIDLDKIPLYIRAGSILPLDLGQELKLQIVPPAINPEIDVQYNGFGQLYSDAADGYGPWRLDQFHVQQVGNEIEVSWSVLSPPNKREYPFPYPLLSLELYGWLAKQVWIDGAATDLSGKRFMIKPFNTLRLQMTR